MAYKDFYTINKSPDGYVCVAVDKDLNVVKQYAISMHNGKLSNCECIAGHTWCRHKKLVVLFNSKNLVGTRTYHNVDRKTNNWIYPPKQEA